MIFVAVFLLFISTAIEASDPRLVEGDIIVDQYVKDRMANRPLRIDGVTKKMWPNARVPYDFSSNFDEDRKKQVMKAIDEYKIHTCIKFVPRTSEKNYVHFIIGGGCYSHVGMYGRGRQSISIGYGCESVGIVIHEMMHALGFFHEQSRRDRDDFVTINWHNIYKSSQYNFKMYSHGVAETFGQPYDYDSIMHYGSHAFSTNGQPTIVPKGDPNQKLGQRNGFSVIDGIQLRKMYKCTGTYGCRDKHPNCQSWASSGLCDKPGHDKYLKFNCCKTCKKILFCQDKNTDCAMWAKAGHCKVNPSYMGTYCRKSCKVDGC